MLDIYLILGFCVLAILATTYIVERIMKQLKAIENIIDEFLKDKEIIKPEGECEDCKQLKQDCDCHIPKDLENPFRPF